MFTTDALGASASTVLPSPRARSGYHVPEEDQDSSSEISIADSLQVLESHPRTFSVPSSHDDSLDEEEVYDTFASKPTKQSTKGQSEVAEPEIDRIGTNDMSSGAELPQSSGNSQANPIDLDKAKPHRDCVDIESDSDDSDYEVEVMPVMSKPTYGKISPQKLDSSPSRQARCVSVEDDDTPNHPQDPLQKQGTQSSLIPKAQRLSPDWDSDDPDDVDFDASDIELPGGVSPSIRRYQQASSNMANGKKPFENFLYNQPSMEDFLRQQSKPQSNVLRTNVENDRTDNTIKHLGTASTERAPSPSDAALAKKASIVRASCDSNGFTKSAGDTSFTYPPYSPYAPVVGKATTSTIPDPYTTHAAPTGQGIHKKVEQASAEDIARDTQARAMRDRILKEKEAHQARLDDQWYQDDNLRASGHPNREYHTENQNPWSETFPDVPEKSYEPPKPYSYGPFASRDGFGKYGDAMYDPYYPQMSLPTDYTSGSMVHAKDDYLRPLHLPPYSTPNICNLTWNPYPPQEHLSSDHLSSKIGGRVRYADIEPSQGYQNNAAKSSDLPLPSSAPLSKTDSALKSGVAQPPRVPIGDLLTPPNGKKTVHLPQPETITPPSSVANSLKRKADVLETDVEEGSDIEISPAISKILDLPDTQQRAEPPAIAESTITQISKDTFVLEGKGSSQSQLETLAARETASPARKKAKTLSSKTGGIVKFLGGVCVGVVGVLAAVVATIPDSVREEAMRELGN